MWVACCWGATWQHRGAPQPWPARTAHVGCCKPHVVRWGRPYDGAAPFTPYNKSPPTHKKRLPPSPWLNTTSGSWSGTSGAAWGVGLAGDWGAVWDAQEPAAAKHSLRRKRWRGGANRQLQRRQLATSHCSVSSPSGAPGCKSMRWVFPVTTANAIRHCRAVQE